MYPKGSIYIVTQSKTSNVRSLKNKNFCMGFVVSKDGQIIDLSCSGYLRTTEEFIKTLLLGKTLSKVDENIIREINERYFASLKHHIIFCYKEGVKAFIKIYGGDEWNENS